ncbi:MAG: hypothetical protein LKH97_09930, partial [Levilactobacillus sp.]|nr:hypothetical protein [Levilactobacillus sp.]
MRPDDEQDSQQPKTRADYRREQERAEREFQERDRKRVQVEKEYARNHGGDQPDEEDNGSEQRISPADSKQNRLKRRLNWAI